MEWSEVFSQDRQPSFEEISAFIQNPFWEELNGYIQNSYMVQPKLSYSKCSAQRGWNVKYQKSGRSLCTLYPMDGYFIALVVIGDREEAEAKLLISTLSPYVRELYEKTPFSCGGRWLMVHVTNKEIAQDIKKLIALRVKLK